MGVGNRTSWDARGQPDLATSLVVFCPPPPLLQDGIRLVSPASFELPDGRPATPPIRERIPPLPGS